MLEKLNSENTNWKTDTAGKKEKSRGEFFQGEWEKLLEDTDQEHEFSQQDFRCRERTASDSRSRQELQVEQQRMINGKMPSIQFWNKNSNTENTGSDKPPRNEITYKVSQGTSEGAIRGMIGMRGMAPYTELADENGVITYHGVKYECDVNKHRLSLGDMTDIDNVMIINLSTGGRLMVNRDNLDDLEKSIDMFSPQDISVIMREIAKDNKMKQLQQELEDAANGIKSADQREEEEQ